MAGSESRIVECINLMVMKKVYWTLVAIFVAAALGGCVNDPTEMENAPDMSAGSRKILTSAEAEAGELLVKFSKESIAAVEAGVTRSESTRTGIQPFDAALKEISAVSVERVIPVVEQHEADARASGLHRWYRVRFNDQVSLDEAARKLAAVEDVEVVQYDGYVARNFTEMSAVPYNNVWSSDRDQINTRSGETPKFNDPMLNKQWHYKNTGDETLVSPIKEGCDINVEPAWKLCTGDPSIIVAVMDEGVMYRHEDLAANMWVNQAELNGQKGVDDDGNGYVDDIYGYNFAKDQGEITWTDPQDVGHGTHVAGTIAAVNNNGIGVCGIAGGSGNNDGVKIMSVQMFAGRYQTTISRNVDAIYYATNMGASILQCSWGLKSGVISSDEQYLDERSIEANAFDHFIKTKRPGSPLNGGIVIFSAGNETGPCGYPAAYPSVVCVTSLSTDFTPSVFTNYGLPADITAPGGDNNYHKNGNQAGKVLSTVPPIDGLYGYKAGTSMSCPHVSGVAALALSYAKKLGKTFEPDEFRSMLLASVNDIDSYLTGIKTYIPYTDTDTGIGFDGSMEMADYRGKMGSGIIDAYKMLMAVRGTPAITVEQDKPTTISLSKYYGDVTALSCMLEVSDAVKDKLGLTFTVEGNNATITCSKQSAGLVTVKSSVGGTSMSREVAIICRAKAASNGGWL